MPLVRFTQNIQRHVACPPLTCEGTTVREVLDAYFELHPDARGYVLDDRGVVRKHMVVFVDGRQVQERDTLADSIGADGTVDVMQALSGG